MKKDVKRSKYLLLLLVVIGIAFIVRTLWGNTALMVNEITISDSHIPPAFSGFRIAQVSDLHNAEFGEGNEKLLQVLSGCDPDATLKGDLFGEVPAMINTKLSGLVSEETGYTVLLSHRPELFETYVSCGIDLVLSGHVHGGQFRLPFVGGLIAPNQGLFPKYDAGLYTEGNTNMVVSRGIGNSIIPIRFNNRPEIIVVTLISL